MKRNKKILPFRVCCFLVLVSLAALTFSACGKSRANKAGESNTPDQVSQEAVDAQSTPEAADEQTTQEELNEPDDSDEVSQEEADEKSIKELTYEQISQEEAKNLMDTEPDAIILDVRTEEEYASGHIVGAICIPNETIDETVTNQLPDKDQLILIYCRSGNRSKQASEKLVDLGYTNIKEFGGINSWTYETE